MRRGGWLLALLVAAPVWAQQCPEGLPRQTPDQHFVFHADGTVTHLRTGLTWTRCPVDTVWRDNGTPDDPSDDRCDGAPTRLIWSAALRKAQAYARSHPAPTPWRLPNLKELATLVETACRAPAVNSTVFPVLDGPVWSATPAPGGAVWVMDFAEGAEQQWPRNIGALPLLLVRDP